MKTKRPERNPVDVYLINNGIDLTVIPVDTYGRIVNLFNNLVVCQDSANKSLNVNSFSPYSDDYRYLYFTREAEKYKARLEKEVAQLKGNSRVK